MRETLPDDCLVPDANHLKALAEFAAGAGHEINNPLATISGRVQMLLRDECDPGRRQSLQTIGGQALRIRDMIGDLMLFARPPEPHPETLDLARLVHLVVERLGDQAAARDCRIEVETENTVPIFADRVQLPIVISCLIQNGLDALVEGGMIHVSARSTSKDQPTYAVLEVADTGPGLSETDRRHLFDPFYSGRQAGRGLGFGLPKCWRIVSNHGGRIEVHSGPTKSTRFAVYWPAETDSE